MLRPRHTFDSVAATLIDGLSTGLILLDEPSPIVPEASEVSSLPQDQGGKGTATFWGAEVRDRISATKRLGETVSFKGILYGREDVQIEGEVEGAIELPENTLIIGKQASVQASIKARQVLVYGSVQGNIEANETVILIRGARLIGDIRTPRITIEDGAFFKGSIDIVRSKVQPVVVPSEVEQREPLFIPSRAESRVEDPGPRARESKSGQTL